MDSVYIDGMFKYNTGLVTKAIADVPADQWTKKPGNGSNHMLWVVGHVIWARGNAAKALGSTWSLSWAKQFARGAETGDMSNYPPVDEIRKAWADVSGELATVFPQASAELLDQPHDKPTFDGKVGGFIAFLAYHETYHVGQLGYLRKWLGHSSLVG
jgi:uncharacterized damage-inducible protein DinB